MNSYPTKNGLPWTSIYRFPEPVNLEKLSLLRKLWDQEDWGEHYQNNMREPAQGAIYPHTRRVVFNPRLPEELTNEPLKNAILDMTEDVKKLFPISMSLLYSELTLLVPKGKVHWHHDRLKTATLATRVMIPLTVNNDIKYYFGSWDEDTPDHDPKISPIRYMSGVIHEVKMSPGFYYTYNHRVPHKTVSDSAEPRGILSLDMIPTKDNKPSGVFSSITEFERTKILPPQI